MTGNLGGAAGSRADLGGAAGSRAGLGGAVGSRADNVARAGDAHDVAHAHDSAHAHDAHEEVTSPDQHRPTVSPRLALLGAVFTSIALVLMGFFGNHEGGIEKVFMVGIAGLILLIVVVNFVMKKSGLRS